MEILNFGDVTQSEPCYVGPCYHDMARPRVADGGDDLQMWMVAVNV
jgi:hypothetical protein